MISGWWEGTDGFKAEAWKGGARDWWMMGRLKWEGVIWWLSDTVLVKRQLNASIFSSSAPSASLSLSPFSVLNTLNIYSPWLLFPFLLIHLVFYHYSVPNIFPSPISLSLSHSLCPSVCLSAICAAWCECLAFEETGVSLCVRNLTAQITWHDETWQITAVHPDSDSAEWETLREREREDV